MIHGDIRHFVCRRTHDPYERLRGAEAEQAARSQTGDDQGELATIYSVIYFIDVK